MKLRSLVIVLACWGCGEAPLPAADLVLVGGTVVTVDVELGVMDAVAVEGHRIVAVGRDQDIRRRIGPDTRVVELAGRTVLPGLVEGHGHFLGLGRSRQVLDLRAAEDFGSIVGQVARVADSAAPGEWIFGMGWHQDKWVAGTEVLVDGVPVNTTLNAVSPDNPVLLNHASGHAAYANDAAFRAAGIDGATADPPGGTIVRDSAGRATGLLREKAQLLVARQVQEHFAGLSPEAQSRQIREQVRLAGLEALSHGITSFHDAGSGFETIDQFAELEAEGALPVRLYVMVRGENAEDLDARLGDHFRPLTDNQFLTVRSIKRQVDGALGAHGAWLLEPYLDLPDTAGLVLEPVAEIEAAARVALKHGFQVNTHAIGTRGNREVLDLYERVWAESGAEGRNLRWRIEHAQHLHPDDVPRFGRLGVIAAIQGVHCTSDGPWIPERLGEPRTGQTSYRWRDLLDSGAVINNGTDVPVEPINPFVSIQASVDRVMNTGEPFHPQQGMTVMEALRSYTLDNAYSAFEDHLKGSVTPGKLADLVVVDRNILEVPVSEIGATQVELTIIGGEVRYSRDQR